MMLGWLLTLSLVKGALIVISHPTRYCDAHIESEMRANYGNARTPSCLSRGEILKMLILVWWKGFKEVVAM